jgi:hypothetical protein
MLLSRQRVEEKLGNAEVHSLVTSVEFCTEGIQEIDENTFGDSFVNATEVYLQDNEIRSVDGLRHLSKMPKLAKLDLIENQIERLPAGIFSLFVNLRKLNLAVNNIKSLDLNCFDPMPNLVVLDLG